ncbi:MAG: hypothetical protein KBD85_03945 [Elusimicrobia bacterium]|nr:hypothetical protein [Elusimicrobiota bacterium]
METEGALKSVFSLGSMGRNAMALFRSPGTLYGLMEKGGGYAAPLLYALVWHYVAAVITLVLSFVKPGTIPGGTTAQVVSFFLLPPVTVGAGFLFAAVFFVIWHLMGSPENYQTAYRVWALLAPLSVVSAVFRLVPYLSLAVSLYYLYLLVVSSVTVHGIRRSKAWTVWPLLMAGFVLAVVMAGVFGAMRGRWPDARAGMGQSPGFEMPRVPPPSPMPDEIQEKMEEPKAPAKK